MQVSRFKMQTSTSKIQISLFEIQISQDISIHFSMPGVYPFNADINI